MQNKKQITMLITLVLATTSLTACNLNKPITETGQTEQEETFKTDGIKDEYEHDILEFLKKHTTSELFTEDFLDNNSLDFETATEDSVKHCYYSNNAIYIQLNNNNMFRFQLDNNGKICSYIIYNLEA